MKKRKTDREKKSLKARPKKVTKVKKGHHVSESYKLDHRWNQVKSELHDVNKEIESQQRKVRTIRRSRKVTSTIIITWLLVVLLFASLLTNSVGVFFISKYLGTNIDEHDGAIFDAGNFSEKIEVMAAENESEDKIVRDEKAKTLQMPIAYRGVMLGRLRTEKKEYYAGEEAGVRSVIILNDRESLDPEVEYNLLDPANKTIYTYSDEAHIYGNNSMIRKPILITKNYEEGRYTVMFKARFDVNGTKYVIPGTAGFDVKERPKANFVAKLGRSITELWWVNKILLVLVILLNLIMVYNSYKAEAEREEREQR